jgi:hypothetical protein
MDKRSAMFLGLSRVNGARWAPLTVAVDGALVTQRRTTRHAGERSAHCSGYTHLFVMISNFFGATQLRAGVTPPDPFWRGVTQPLPLQTSGGKQFGAFIAHLHVFGGVNTHGAAHVCASAVVEMNTVAAARASI